jgi:hypothetical protein
MLEHLAMDCTGISSVGLGLRLADLGHVAGWSENLYLSEQDGSSFCRGCCRLAEEAVPGVREYIRESFLSTFFDGCSPILYATVVKMMVCNKRRNVNNTIIPT